MDPNQTCELLLSSIKDSNLNFSLIESPFAVSVSIKKSFIKDKNGSKRASKLGGIQESRRYESQLIDENQILQDEKMSLKAIIAQHERENQAVKAIEATKKDFDKQLKTKIHECDDLKIELAKISEELHHTKIEVTNLKNLSNDLKRERSRFEKELISNKKANEKNESDFLEELNKARTIIENIENELEEATSANDDLKKEISANKNKISTMNEKLAATRIKNLDSKSTSSCQTDDHPDIPYSISLPLPPIFSSSLCFYTPRIKRLTRSLRMERGETTEKKVDEENNLNLI